MKFSSLTAIAFAVSSVAIGCASPAPAPEEGSVESSAEALTVAQCNTQRDACFAKNPLFGLFTCPAQYTQCTATASNGVPAQVTAAIADVVDCTDAGLDCVAEAGTNPVELAVCAEDEAQCVAAIVDVDLPDVVEGTAACVDGGVDCIKAAKTVSDLAACGETLVDCAVEEVQAVLPPEVAQVVGDVTDCTSTFESCVTAAQTATALTACSEAQVACVAGSLDVTLPNIPASEVVSCAETAANCALDVSSLSDVAACADGLASCAADVVETVAAPVLTCNQKFNTCMKNPFNFLKCSAELAVCK